MQLRFWNLYRKQICHTEPCPTALRQLSITITHIFACFYKHQ